MKTFRNYCIAKKHSNYNLSDYKGTIKRRPLEILVLQKNNQTTIAIATMDCETLFDHNFFCYQEIQKS